MSEWITVRAPAKVNLTLHVTGQRADGYHLLDSLVVFAPAHDVIGLKPAKDYHLTVTGREAEGVPADHTNLVMKAARALDFPARIDLAKALPSAAGIGGGSADAAALVRGILFARNAWQDRGDADLLQIAEAYSDQLSALGADVPMCLTCVPLRARGIGLPSAFPPLPALPAVLINPRRSVSTAEVFRRLDRKDNDPMPDTLPTFTDATALIAFLADQRNDLQAAAMGLEPRIADVLAALDGQQGCGLARMSGSGATCFGLFADEDDARAAAQALGTAHPEWWVAGGTLGSQRRLGAPEFS